MTALLPALVVSRLGDRRTNQLARHFEMLISATRTTTRSRHGGALAVVVLARVSWRAFS